MWLGEDQLKNTMDKVIIDKMTINLDVFSPFMENIIVSNMNGIMVVTIKKE